jgi:hypothetical protein
MANNTDPNKHIPAGVEFGTVERLEKTFRNLHGTFSDLEGENIVLFAKNVDKYKLQSLIPSLEMGMIVITCLQGEPYIRARRWMDTTDQDQTDHTQITGVSNLAKWPHHSCHMNRKSCKNHIEPRGKREHYKTDHRTRRAQRIQAR